MTWPQKKHKKLLAELPWPSWFWPSKGKKMGSSWYIFCCPQTLPSAFWNPHYNQKEG
jgi:hypothetical protein